MAWRDNLRAASFRGVKFNVESAGLTAGRRLARHEYPQRDIPYLEDMGRKAREYKVEAFILGDPDGSSDYMTGRDQLLEAIETAGPGQLVHPYHGTMQVVVSGDAQLTESTREGGIAKFSITFIEAGKQLEPATSADTEASLSDQQNACTAASSSEFESSFSVDGEADFVVDDALEQTDDFLSLPDIDLGDLSWIRADPLSQLTDLLPENLLASLANPLALAAGVMALIRSASSLSSLFDFSDGLLASSAAAAVVAETPSRETLVGNQAAFGNLVLQAATAQHVVNLATSAPSTLDETRAIRSEIVSRIDTVLFGDGVSTATTNAMVQLRTDALEHLSSNAVDLPSLMTVTNKEVRPAIVLAHDFYGDGWEKQGRDLDIVTRNAVPHPGFVPAGKPLQFVAE